MELFSLNRAVTALLTFYSLCEGPEADVIFSLESMHRHQVGLLSIVVCPTWSVLSLL